MCKAHSTMCSTLTLGGLSLAWMHFAMGWKYSIVNVLSSSSFLSFLGYLSFMLSFVTVSPEHHESSKCTQSVSLSAAQTNSTLLCILQKFLTSFSFSLNPPIFYSTPPPIHIFDCQEESAVPAESGVHTQKTLSDFSCLFESLSCSQWWSIWPP